MRAATLLLYFFCTSAAKATYFSRSFEKNAFAHSSSIFVHIASYRDSLCRRTVLSALSTAHNASRLAFGIVVQTRPSGRGNDLATMRCIPFESECAVFPAPYICEHKARMRTLHISASSALGPTFARHFADSLYAGEDFALQIDSHMIFSRHWDVNAIEDWKGEFEFSFFAQCISINIFHLTFFL